jgi:predicted RNase H-like nuclease
MMHAHKVAYGYLPDFKGDSVILFAGNQQALEALADFLDTIVQSPTNVTMMLDTEPLFAAKRGIRLTLTVADSALGMKRVGASPPEPRFEWRVSKSMATQFAKLARAIADAAQPSHQYLDADGVDEVTVIVSKGEYDEAWLQQQR